ncbi:MAG: alpha/beta hydrolase family esterase, partial [Gemmatimonadales bacterium]
MRERFAWAIVGLISTACLGEQFDPAADLREGGFEVISSGGLLRRFLVHAPTSIQGPGDPPLVIAFHGAGQTPEELRQLTALDDLADRQRFVVAYPEAYRPTGGTWGVHAGSPVERVGVFDLLFVVDLIDFLAARFDIDRGRVYAVGYSSGGQVSHRVGCEL